MGNKIRKGNVMKLSNDSEYVIGPCRDMWLFFKEHYTDYDHVTLIRKAREKWPEMPFSTVKEIFFTVKNQKEGNDI